MMRFDGKIETAAPRERVWEFLLDVHEFASCMPGLERVTEVDDRTFDGVLSAAVGPIAGKFTFRSTIVESTPPRDMMVRTEGTDSVTGSNVGVDVNVHLSQLTEDRTELGYHAEVEIRGRLAILGDMIIRATAALLLEEFARRLRKKLEDGGRVE